MDKKLPPQVDQRISKQASAFVKNLNVVDLNPTALTWFGYFEGRKDEYLDARAASSADVAGWIEQNNPYTNPTAAAFWKEGAEALANFLAS